MTRCVCRSMRMTTSMPWRWHRGLRTTNCSSSVVLLRICTARMTALTTVFRCPRPIPSSVTPSRRPHSGVSEVAEELLEYFVETGNKECYAAMLFACYDLLAPDFVMEVSWRHALSDFTMPYQIQQARDTRTKLLALEKEVRERAAKDSAKEKEDLDTPILGPGAFANKLLTSGTGGVEPIMMQPTAGSMFN